MQHEFSKAIRNIKKVGMKTVAIFVTRARRTRGLWVFFPAAATGLTAAALLIVGIDLSITLGVSGLILGLSSFAASAGLAGQPLEVLIIRGSRSVGSGLRARGVADVLGHVEGIRIRVVTPPSNEDRPSDWRKNTVLEALARQVRFLVIENPGDDVGPEFMDLLTNAARSGTHVIIIGDPPLPEHAEKADICTVAADPGVGGFLAGQAFVRAMRERHSSVGVLLIRSYPTYRRPRAAYSTLAIALEGMAHKTRLVAADNTSTLEPVVSQVVSICEKFQGEVVIGCTTDAQLVTLSRMLKASLP